MIEIAEKDFRELKELEPNRYYLVGKINILTDKNGQIISKKFRKFFNR